MKTITDEEYEELIEWRKWGKILLDHPTWSLKIEKPREAIAKAEK